MPEFVVTLVQQVMSSMAGRSSRQRGHVPLFGTAAAAAAATVEATIVGSSLPGSDRRFRSRQNKALSLQQLEAERRTRQEEAT